MPSGSEYLNAARVLYVHHGHESHVLLQVGHIYLPAHMYQCTDLGFPENEEEGFSKEIILVNLTTYNTLIGPYEAAEDNPLFGIHTPLWGDDDMVGRINVASGVMVRRPDSMTMTTSSPIEWGGVIIEGFGKIIALDEDESPVISSCGVIFFADIERWDRPEIPLEKGDLVTFEGHLAAFRSG